MKNEISVNRSLAITGALGALIIVLFITHLGFIPWFSGAAITILQVPVILGALLAGLWPSVGLGAIFGIASLIQASISPTGGLDPYFTNPLISVVPRMLIGFVYTILGLVLFLTGVNVGFAPVGNFLGETLGSGQYKLLLIPIGALVGYFIVKAEPAVQVLNAQVDEITGGIVSHKMMNTALSIGVAGAVVLSMVRVITGLHIYYIVIPGYLIALLLTRIVPTVFVGIAFDSGGVASGPMTSTFLLPLAMGACNGVGGNVLTDAFGVVALVALSPLLTIQLMGVIYSHKSKAVAVVAQNVPDELVDLEG